MLYEKPILCRRARLKFLSMNDLFSIYVKKLFGICIITVSSLDCRGVSNGSRNYDVQKAFEAVKKMETTPAWKIGHGLAGNRDLVPFLKYHYVPYDLGRFSNTLEYAYDNWTVAQFAKSLGKEEDFRLFSERGTWWQNAINPETGYAQMRKSDKTWMEPFNPLTTVQNAQYCRRKCMATHLFCLRCTRSIHWIGKILLSPG